ncbi:MAG: NAD-dependent epimerase/dehydratase family protein [Pseudomonadota bacterium]
MDYLIVGAGYTGRRLARQLDQERVWTTRRPQRDLEAQALPLDLDRPEVRLPHLPTPWTLVYTVPPPESAADDDPRVDALLRAIPIDPARIVYLSTSGVYGDRQGRLTDETTVPNPTPARARRRLAAERRLQDWCRERATQLVILRVPGIYGPGRLGLDRRRANEPVLRGRDAAPGNRIHVDDLVGACLATIADGAPEGIFNVGDGDHRSSTAFASIVARLAGLPAPAEIGLEEAKARWSAQRLSFVLESRRLDTTRMRTELGFTPRYGDPEDGVRASLGG